MADVLVRLPDEHRDAFKEPLGVVHPSLSSLLADLNGAIITVGDVVTYHAEQRGIVPDVAVVDGRTKREAVDPAIETALDQSDAEQIAAMNPPGTLTASLLNALKEAFDREESVQITVDGEEDLAALPAILLAPDGAHVLYGQPDEGVVHVPVTDESRERALTLLGQLTGDHERLSAVLER